MSRPATPAVEPLHPTPRPALVVAAFAAVYVVWGSTYLAIRFVVETMPPFTMAGARFLVAGLILFLWARLRGGASPSRRDWRIAAVTGVLLLLGGNGALVWAEQRVASGMAALLVATLPVWMVLIDWFRPGGTRPRAGVFAGLALGVAGLVLLVGRGVGEGAPVDALATVVLVFGTISWAAGSIYLRQQPTSSGGAFSNGMQMLAGGAALAFVGIASGELSGFDTATVTARSMASLAYLTFVGSLVGFTAYTYILKVSTPARVSTYAYVNPVVAMLLGWALADEPLTARTLVAAAVILSGVAVITMAGGSRSPGGAARPLRGKAAPERRTSSRGDKLTTSTRRHPLL